MVGGPGLLKQWRLSHGYSQATAANELEVAQSAYSDWETGKKTPRLAGLLKITAKTGIAAAAFAEGGEERDGSRAASTASRDRKLSPPDPVPPSSRHPKATKKPRPAKARRRPERKAA